MDGLAPKGGGGTSWNGRMCNGLECGRQTQVQKTAEYVHLRLTFKTLRLMFHGISPSRGTRDIDRALKNGLLVIELRRRLIRGYSADSWGSFSAVREKAVFELELS